MLGFGHLKLTVVACISEGIPIKSLCKGYVTVIIIVFVNAAVRLHYYLAVILFIITFHSQKSGVNVCVPM